MYEDKSDELLQNIYHPSLKIDDIKTEKYYSNIPKRMNRITILITIKTMIRQEQRVVIRDKLILSVQKFNRKFKVNENINSKNTDINIYYNQIFKNRTYNVQNTVKI